MTPEELQAIKKRNAARTQGLWVGRNASEWKGRISMTRISTAAEDIQEQQTVISAEGNDIKMKEADAIFVICASKDVPALIEEIERQWSLTTIYVDAEGSSHIGPCPDCGEWMFGENRTAKQPGYAVCRNPECRTNKNVAKDSDV